eukprot:747902-Hanusia_phi.AAC.4
MEGEEVPNGGADCVLEEHLVAQVRDACAVGDDVANVFPTLKKSFEDQHNGFLRAMKLQVGERRAAAKERRGGEVRLLFSVKSPPERCSSMQRQQQWMRFNSLDGYASWNHMRHFQPSSAWAGGNHFNA